jgi:hypothetical protein
MRRLDGVGSTHNFGLMLSLQGPPTKRTRTESAATKTGPERMETVLAIEGTRCWHKTSLDLISEPGKMLSYDAGGILLHA